MHEPLIGNLEDYLHGKTSKEVTEHLSNCRECRDEAGQMRQHATMLQSLRAPGFEPASGFYARVMNRIEVQARPSIWNLFGESLFAQRLAYSSLTLLVLLGTFFISTSQEPIVASTPEAIMAVNEEGSQVGQDPERDREAILVNLATYQE